MLTLSMLMLHMTMLVLCEHRRLVSYASSRCHKTAVHAQSAVNSATQHMCCLHVLLSDLVQMALIQCILPACDDLLT